MKEGHRIENVSFWEKLLTLVFVFTPHPALVLGVFLFYLYGFEWLPIILFAVFFAVTGPGITIGFHRYFTHKSFEIKSPSVKYAIAACGMASAEMSLFDWVAHHRVHHKFSDEDGDPHSPHHHGSGCMGIARGFWHAHMGWFSKRLPNEKLYIKDLLQDKGLVRVNKLFPLWVFLGFFLPALIAFLCTGSMYSAFLGFLWGGWIRLGAVYHVTWSINSICHIWGSRRFNTTDKSRNNPIFGIIGLGEGWHNNHHAIQNSARHGLYWWEIDFSWYVIWLMWKLGIVHSVKVPSEAEIEQKRERLGDSE